MGGGEQLLTDITTSTSFQSTSGPLKSTNFATQEQTSHCYSKPVVQSESQALSANLPILYRDIEFWKKSLVYRYTDESDCNYTWEELDKPKEFAGSNMTLPLELNDSTLSSSCLKAVSPLSMLHAAYSLRGCSQPSFPLRKSVQKSTSVVGELRTSSNWILESWHSQRLEHISLDRLLLKYCVVMAFEFRSWMSARKTQHS